MWRHIDPPLQKKKEEEKKQEKKIKINKLLVLLRPGSVGYYVHYSDGSCDNANTLEIQLQ